MRGVRGGEPLVTRGPKEQTESRSASFTSRARSDCQPLATLDYGAPPLDDSELLWQLFAHLGGIPLLGRVKEPEMVPTGRHYSLS